MSDAPWQIVKSDPADQPPEHDPEKPWVVLHPRAHEHRARRITRCATHAEALAFVLAQPEVRRRTSNAARALQGVAAAFDAYERSHDA